MTSHVIFDFDGVLCDSLNVCVDEYEKLRLSEFPEIPQVSMQSRMDEAYQGLLKHSLDRWLGAERAASFFNLHSAAINRRSKDLLSFPGIAELLVSMPERSASIVSSAYSPLIYRVLSVNGGLPKSVRFVSGREYRQPKSKKILDILQAMNTSVDDALYVGDLESDLQYCEQIPIRCVLVTYGYHSATYLRSFAGGAHAFIDSVSELTDLIGSELSAQKTPTSN